jgi:hypothetical protein
VLLERSAHSRRMKLAIASTRLLSMILVLFGCEARHATAQVPEDDAGSVEAPADAAVAQGGAADAGAPVLPDAGPPPPPTPPGQWVRDSSVPAGYGPDSTFHASQAGDLWLEIQSGEGPSHVALFRRRDGAWPLFFEMDLRHPLVWIRSSQEAWILEDRGVLHVVTPTEETITNLSQTGRFFSAIGDGWLAYQEALADPSARCQRIGFLRHTDGGFSDVPATDACWPVTDIYGNAAVTVEGEVLFWNGSNWRKRDQFPSSNTGPFYGTLSGDGTNDLYLLGSTWRGMQTIAYHLQSGLWTPFSLDNSESSSRIISLWARPWSPRWALNRSDAFEWDGAGWRNRGPKPTTLAAELPGNDAIGSDGADVFVTGEWVHSGAVAIWIYRYVR